MRVWNQFIAFLATLLFGDVFRSASCSWDSGRPNSDSKNPIPEDRLVVNLTEEDYNNKVLNTNSDIIWLVKYFAPWCGHCRNLYPEIIKVSEFFEGNDKVKIAKVDCTVESSLCKKNSIDGYPTMRLYYKGKYLKQYKSPKRSHNDIIRFIERGMQPDVIIIENTRHLEKLSYDLVTYPVFVILFNEKSQLNSHVPLLESISDGNNFEITLSVTYDDHVREKLIDSHKEHKYSEPGECLNMPCMVVLGKENHSPIVRLGENAEYVLSFIQQYRFPFLGIPSKLDFIDYLNSGNLIVIIAVDERASTQANKTELADELYRISMRVRDEMFLPVKFGKDETPRGIIFAVIDFKPYSSLFREYGITHFNFMQGYEIVIADGLKYYYNSQEYMRIDVLYDTIELLLKQDKRIPRLKAYSIFSKNSIKRFLYDLNTAISTIFYKSWYHAAAITTTSILLIAGIMSCLCLLLFGDKVESYLLDDITEMEDKSMMAPSGSDDNLSDQSAERDGNAEGRKER